MEVAHIQSYARQLYEAQRLEGDRRGCAKGCQL